MLKQSFVRFHARISLKLKRMYAVVSLGLVLGYVFLSGWGARAHANEPERQSTQTRVMRIAPYRSPFGSYADYMRFLKSVPAVPRWTDEILHEAFPQAVYNSCFDPEHMELVEIIYKSPNGITRGWSARPREAQRATPLVVFNRGGFSTWGRILHYHLAMMCMVASHGYTVVASDFRGVPDVQGPQAKSDLGFEDTNDSFYLIEAVSQLYPDIETSRFAVWGASRGTSISVMMASQSESVALVILHGMVADFVHSHRREEFDQHVFPLVFDNYQKLSRKEQDRLLERISPTHLVEKMKTRPAFVLFHGSLDQRTSPEDALAFAAQLLRLGFPVEFSLYPYAAHSFSETTPDYLDKVIHALDQHLDHTPDPTVFQSAL